MDIKTLSRMKASQREDCPLYLLHTLRKMSILGLGDHAIQPLEGRQKRFVWFLAHRSPPLKFSKPIPREAVVEKRLEHHKVIHPVGVLLQVITYGINQ